MRERRNKAVTILFFSEKNKFIEKINQHLGNIASSTLLLQRTRQGRTLDPGSASLAQVPRYSGGALRDCVHFS